jgi:hypothetical protein
VDAHELLPLLGREEAADAEHGSQAELAQLRLAGADAIGLAEHAVEVRRLLIEQLPHLVVKGSQTRLDVAALLSRRIRDAADLRACPLVEAEPPGVALEHVVERRPVPPRSVGVSGRRRPPRSGRLCISDTHWCRYHQRCKQQSFRQTCSSPSLHDRSDLR